jgi:hypothetical protein
MRSVITVLESVTPMCQRKFYEPEKESGETHQLLEQRTWRDRVHFDPDRKDEIYIPAMALKNCLSEAAKFLSEKIPGRNKETYTKHFEAGILVTDNAYIGMSRDGLEPLWLPVPSDGKRGGGSRVKKCFAVIQKWKASVEWYALSDEITKEVFIRTLERGGQFIGLGSLRVRNNGIFGRYRVLGYDWKGNWPEAKKVKKKK